MLRRDRLYINCTIDKYIYRNKKSGESVFSVIPDGINAFREQLTVFGNIQCRGYVPEYPAMLPVRISVSKGKDGYDVWNMVPYAYSDEAVVQFMASGYFKGIGTKKSESIVKANGRDIFDENYGESYIRECLLPVVEYKKISDVICSAGGDFKDADRYFYEHRKFEDIENDPYSLCDVLDFAKVDRIARKMGADEFSWSRYQAMIDSALRSAESSGSTCIDLQSLLGRVMKYDESVDPVYLMTVLLSGTSGRYVLINDELLYRREMYEYESNTERYIQTMIRKAEGFDEFSQSLIDDVEKEKDITYSDMQKEAISLISSSGIKVITGGPGTGKTTIVDGILSVFKKMFPDKRIILAAPTANAAKRMREKTGCNAMTVHKMLGIRPFRNGKDLDFRHLDEDLVIIDESSFIDIKLASILMQAVKNTSTLIFVGDADQLPSVGPGRFFLDLIRSNRVPVCILDRIYRQDGASNIVKNAECIRNGNGELSTGDDFEVIRVPVMDDKSSFAETVINEFSKYYRKESPFSVRLYSPVKKRDYLISTRNLNDELQSVYRSSDKYIVNGVKKYYVGDPVIFTRNNYEEGYCNGDEGVVISVTENSMTIKLDDDYIETEDFDDIDLAYAITTHKSQGSECDIGIVVVPAQPVSMLNRAMLYVAATRARNKTIIISEGGSLETAVLNRYRRKRTTGLFYKEDLC
jgi:ATP-dependent exoDNAse (exonuclease V), alpha subunit - helicase superfamily I member